MCCLKIRMKYDFIRIVPSTQATPCCYGASGMRRRECTQATLVVEAHPGMCKRGYVIPDSHFRSQVVYMRWAVPVWVSSLRDRRCAWPGGLPRTELLYIVDTFTQYVLYFDLYCYYIMFLLPKFIMLIKLVKLYYVCSLSWPLFTFKY